METKYYIGIDPGLAATGWAILAMGRAATVIGSGTARTVPTEEHDIARRVIRMTVLAASGIRRALQPLNVQVRCAVELSDAPVGRKNAPAVIAQVAVAGALIYAAGEFCPDIARVTPKQWMWAAKPVDCHRTVAALFRDFDWGETSDHSRDAICIAWALATGRIDTMIQQREAAERTKKAVSSMARKKRLTFAQNARMVTKW